MRLVWAVLPLIILGIIETSESFAEEKISAHVEGGALLNIKKIDELGSVNFEINTQNQSGSVVIELPKSVWHIADSECNPISPIILVDGKETTFTDYFETNNRIITINAVKGAKIIELIVTGPAAPHTTSLMYGQFCFLQEQYIFIPPKKQLDLGFMPYDVQCKDALVKMIKNYNNLPVCVYPKTAEKLIERWRVTPHSSNGDILGHTDLKKEINFSINSFYSNNDSIYSEEELIIKLVEEQFKTNARPILDQSYEKVDVDIKIKYYSDIHLFAEYDAKISGEDGYDRYALYSDYDIFKHDLISPIFSSHPSKYVPEHIKEIVIKSAKETEQVKEFLESTKTYVEKYHQSELWNIQYRDGSYDCEGFLDSFQEMEENFPTIQCPVFSASLYFSSGIASTSIVAIVEPETYKVLFTKRSSGYI